jgi:hypothetical protein
VALVPDIAPKNGSGLSLKGWAVIVALAVAMSKGIDIGTTKFKNERVQKVELIEDQADALDTVVEFSIDMNKWHNATDTDGIPLGYTPRSPVEDIMDTQEKMCDSLEEIARIQERIADKLDQ